MCKELQQGKNLNLVCNLLKKNNTINCNTITCNLLKHNIRKAYENILSIILTFLRTDFGDILIYLMLIFQYWKEIQSNVEFLVF